MLGVVAVLHVGPGELAETQRHLDEFAAVEQTADPVHVLARPALPGRRRLAIAAEDDAFLEMHVHRVLPAVPAILDTPDFQGARRGRRTALGRSARQLDRCG
ncbi:hypothetical protein D9M70_586260 [compost metagenome]